MTGSRPRVLAVLPILGPSTIMCVVKPLVRLHRAGYVNAKITLEPLASRRQIEWADLVVFCRNTEPRYAHWLNLVLCCQTPFIYDLDDNLFEVPLHSEMGQYHRDPGQLALLTHYVSQASLVRVYSAPLFERVQALNPRVEKVAGPVDLSLISPAPSRPNPTRVKLVYATSRSVDELADIFMPALVRVLGEYAGQVEVHFWGYNPSGLHGLRDVHFHPVVLDYDRFLRQFSQAGFDIGLAPLPDDVFYRSKTNNKFREYGASRIAGIYSNIDVYSTCVKEGETGLLVPNEPEAWYNALVRLISDRSLREKIKDQAQEYVRQRYSQQDFEQVWWTQMQSVLANRPSHSTGNLPPTERELAEPFEQENACREKSVLQRLICRGPKIIYTLLSQEPQVFISALRRYWNTCWMLLKIGCLMARVIDLDAWRARVMAKGNHEGA